jgi:hypothetical protein
MLGSAPVSTTSRTPRSSSPRRDVESKRFDGMEQDALGVWTSPSGARVLWFADPDGNVLSVTR